MLLIDDEQIMHDLSRAYLDRAGYQLISAYNGKSGLRMLLSEKQHAQATFPIEIGRAHV